ncbi:MAG: rod shape-determining protein [Ethanoligenens sp.]
MAGSDIGIDLGTATVLINIKGKGIVLQEPSVVAVDKNTNQVVATGEQAQKMIGRTPADIMAVRPLRGGVISNFDLTGEMLRYFIKRVCNYHLFKPRIMICVPSLITEVEERAVYDAAMQAGARKVYLVEEPIAAAIGAGLNITEPNGNMIVDIGGGTTDIAVISLKDTAVSTSIKIAGDVFNEMIVKFIRRKYNVLIGERTAENVKIAIGCVSPRETKETIAVKGRSLMTGLPKMVETNSEEIREVLEAPVHSILEAVHSVLERTPPELVGDIVTNGIVLTGGGSLLYGMDKRIQEHTGISTRVADDPVTCVARGTGLALEHLNILEDGLIHLSRQNRDR